AVLGAAAQLQGPALAGVEPVELALEPDQLSARLLAVLVEPVGEDAPQVVILRGCGDGVEELLSLGHVRGPFPSHSSSLKRRCCFTASHSDSMIENTTVSR